MFALTFIIQKALNKPMKNLLKKPKKSVKKVGLGFFIRDLYAVCERRSGGGLLNGCQPLT